MIELIFPPRETGERYLRDLIPLKDQIHTSLGKSDMSEILRFSIKVLTVTCHHRDSLC